MSSLPLDARPSRLRTRLEASLIRLQAAVRRGIQREATNDALYAQWQDRWASRREDLARRLAAIDSQLDSWAPSELSAPRLALMAEADETGPVPSIEID
jgi:hypothetical protein